MAYFRLSKVMCLLAPTMLAGIPTLPVYAVNPVLTTEQVTSHDDYDQVLQQWKTHLTSVSLDATNKLANKAQQTLLDNNSFDFSEQSSSGVKIRATVNTIRDLAVNYNRLGSTFYQDQDAKQLIISSLEKIHSGGYQEGGKEYGNWWNWNSKIIK